MTSIDGPRLAVRSPADLLAAVPYLLGFHPRDSVVVVALRGRRIIFAARADLPDPADPVTPARHLALVIARQAADTATVLGYGPATRVTPAVDAVRAALADRRIDLLDALRVTDGRYWSYLCAEPECCPPDGNPYDPSASEVTATAVFAGQVALPDRAALRARVAPVEGPERAALTRAAVRAERRLVDLLDRASPTELASGRLLRAAGATMVRRALRGQRRGRRLTDDEVAWLALLLTDETVRDLAWERTDGREEDIALWADVFRRAEPEFVAVPGTLLAFAAWRAGQGALAAVALERTLAVHPDHPLARLLDELLRQGVPPERLARWPALGPAARRRRRPNGRGAR